MSEKVDLDALEALAKAATPGPWVLDNSGWSRPYSVPDRIAGGISENDWTNVITPQDEQGGGSWSRDEDAEYIAAADPSTVLALIAELRQERERADEAWRIGAAQHGYDPTDDEQAGNFMRLAKRADRAEAALSRAEEKRDELEANLILAGATVSDVLSALSRAEETIEKALAILDADDVSDTQARGSAINILTDYDKQKEADRG
ncbi:ead/Ea22-like family protein [Microbacterium sp. XT11]|uniref:ead/Ea22-like family protein n=1 Tax=Microbacterium sp. XT11 TaxID=367477 RepID=UPI0008332315|nr:ead/Ea22-like family protein [Microbacterium sp. XT11]